MLRSLSHGSLFGPAGPGRLTALSFAVVVCLAAMSAYGLGGHLLGKPHPAAALALPPAPAPAPAPAPVPARAPSLHGPAPGPAEFARQLAGMANQLAMEQGEDERLDRVDCVQASTGHYMCSYAVLRPSRPIECHVIQAIWTPTQVDSFKVTLSGLAGKCGSLREALHSLQ
jgi:hypothetical protein